MRNFITNHPFKIAAFLVFGLTTIMVTTERKTYEDLGLTRYKTCDVCFVPLDSKYYFELNETTVLNKCLYRGNLLVGSFDNYFKESVQDSLPNFKLRMSIKCSNESMYISQDLQAQHKDKLYNLDMPKFYSVLQQISSSPEYKSIPIESQKRRLINYQLEAIQKEYNIKSFKFKTAFSK